MEHQVALDKAFIYYNKLQVIVNSSKMAHYETKSDFITKTLKSNIEHHQEIIEVVNTYILLRQIMDRKLRVTERSQLVVRCLTNFLKAFAVKEMSKEPFKTYHEKVKKSIESLTSRIKCKETLETCFYCETPIQSDKLACNENHLTNRCSITKVQLPLMCNNFCLNCQISFVEQATLNEVVDKKDQLCTFCDRPILFT
jgi:hypothetical protein